MNLNQLVTLMLNNNTRFNNPVLDNAVQMYKQNNIAGLEEMARNMAKEKGVSVEDLLRKLGFNL